MRSDALLRALRSRRVRRRRGNRGPRRARDLRPLRRGTRGRGSGGSRSGEVRRNGALRHVAALRSGAGSRGGRARPDCRTGRPETGRRTGPPRTEVVPGCRRPGGLESRPAGFSSSAARSGARERAPARGGVPPPRSGEPSTGALTRPGGAPKGRGRGMPVHGGRIRRSGSRREVKPRAAFPRGSPGRAEEAGSTCGARS